MAAAAARVTELDASAPTLALLLRGLYGRGVQVQPRGAVASSELPPRPVLTESHLLLPESHLLLPAACGAIEGRDECYRLHRAAVAHAVAHLLHSPRGQPVLTLKPMSVAVVSALEDARVERLLTRSYPGVRRWFLEFLENAAQPRATNFDALTFESLIARLGLALLDPNVRASNHWIDKARDLFEAQAQRDLLDHAAFRRAASILANDLGQMRVRFDLTRYVVPAPYRDDNSFLWDFGAAKGAPQESVELQVRAQRLEHRPNDAAPDDPINPLWQPEVELGRFSYPEWDHRRARRKADWCTVVERLPGWEQRAASTPIVLRDMASATVPLRSAPRLGRAQRLRRQWEGEDIDLNAAVEVMVDQRLHLVPDPRLFMRPGRQQRASRILVLLDLSESTNDRSAGAPLSILDIEKAAALLLAQSIRQGGTDRIAIHGFSSNTREDVGYYRLLDFGAALDASALNRVRAAPGRHSTRIGAALRHATAELVRAGGEHRTIVVVTDGAPADIDVFDGRYLVEDARVAVLEARRCAVQAYGVVLDPKADPYARRIFGWRNYRVVDDPQRLPAHLSHLYARAALA